MSYNCRNNFHNSTQIPIIFVVDNKQKNEEEECLGGGFNLYEIIDLNFFKLPT